MRKFLSTFLSVLICCITLSAQDTLLIEDFETDGEGIRYTSNHFVDVDSNDYWERTSSVNLLLPPAQFSGSALINTAPQSGNYWASENTDTLESPAAFEGFLSLNPVSIIGRDSIDVSVFIANTQFGLAKWEANDSLNIDIRIDGGAWQTIGRFVGNGSPTIGGELQIDADLNGLADTMGGAIVTATFTEFVFSPAVSGNNLELRIRARSDGTEELAFDQILISGAELPEPPMAVCQNPFIYLDAMGNATVSVSDVNNGSTAESGIDTLILITPITTFTCNNIGNHVYTFVVIDSLGASDTCTGDIFVNDSIPPTLTCPMNITVGNDAGLCGAIVNYNIDFDDNCFDTTNLVNISLERVLFLLDNLDIDESVTDQIDDQYDFELDEGEDATFINDGGGDMYDDGNFINTNLSTSDISYTENDILTSTDFGPSGRYFTFYDSDGFFILAADLDNVNTFEISGETGADSDGFADGFQSTITVFGVNYNIFVKRVIEDEGSGDPSINHLIIIPENVGASQTFAIDTDDDFHEVTGLAGSTRLYYLLFAGDDSEYIDNATMTSMAISFISSFSGLKITLDEGFSSGALFPVGTTTVEYTIEDLDGNDVSCSFDVTVNDVEPPVVNCTDTTIYLDASGNATLDQDQVVVPPLYTIDQSGVFAPIDINGISTPFSLNDDQVTVALPIGFSFNFYGNNYTNFHFSSNGFITFNGGESDGCCDGDDIPDTDEPNNYIAFAWSDLDPEEGGDIRYATVGTAPNRILIAEFFEIEHISSGNFITSQVHLFEGSNRIEIHTTEVTESSGHDYTMGIENADGSIGLGVPGRIQGEWTVANDFVAFDPPVEYSLSDNCGIDNIDLSQTLFTCTDLGSNETTVIAVDEAGNEDSCTATITVLDTIAPELTCPNDTTVTFDGSCELTLPDYIALGSATDNCGGSLTIAQSPLATTVIAGATIVTFTSIDASGNAGTCTFTVIPNEATPPTAICQDITIYLDDSGIATVDPTAVDNGSTDDCGMAALTFSVDKPEFLCADFSGPIASDLFISEYVEGGTGFGSRKAIEIYNGTGSAVDLAAGGYVLYRYTNGSSTPVGSGLSLSGTIANGDVYLIVNSSAGTSLTNIADSLSAYINHNGDDAYLLAKSNGADTIDIFGTIGEDGQNPPDTHWFGGGNSTRNSILVRNSAVLSGVTSNTSGFPTLEAEWISFPDTDLSNLGSHTIAHGVTLTVTDGSGNSSTCISEITILDTIFPSLECTDITAFNSSIIVPVSTSTDFGSFFGNSLDVTYNGSGLSEFPSLVAVHDESDQGNSWAGSSVAGSITFNFGGLSAINGLSFWNMNNDLLPDAAGIQDVVCLFSIDGISFDTIIGGPTIFALANGIPTSPEIFSFPEITASHIRLDVISNYGFFATGFGEIAFASADSNCETTVTFADPTIIDNCPTTTTLTQIEGLASGSAFPFGITVNTFVVSDTLGNSDTCSFNVEILDEQAPTALCVDSLTINLGATLTTAAIDNGSFDNCSDVSLSIGTTMFDCNSSLINEVTLTVADTNGNVSTCISIITIIDTIAPTINCLADTSVVGDPVLCGADVVLGMPTFDDNCGTVLIPKTEIVLFNFDENDELINTPATLINASIATTDVMLQLTFKGDFNGTSECFTLNGPDNIEIYEDCNDNPSCTELGGIITIPQATWNNWVTTFGSNLIFTLQDDDDVDDDQCATIEDNYFEILVQSNANIVSVLNSYNGTDDASDFYPTGATTITWTVIDKFGNEDSCMQIVTVTDTVAPTFNCPSDTTVYPLAGNCDAVVSYIIDSLANDNCSDSAVIVQLSGIASGGTFPIGITTNTYTAQDEDGNVSSCSFTVTVLDTIAPTAVCQNITAYLDSNGLASITGASVDGGSTDNCGPVTLAVDISSFNCGQDGQTIDVTLTVTDSSGNANSCNAQVTVNDTIPPNAVCENLTVYLDGSGAATIDEDDIENGSTDNCGFTNALGVDVTDFTCLDIGDTTVTVTLGDGNGNQSTCSAILTVADTTSPTASCQNITIFLDGAGNASIVAADIDNGSSDNCTTVILGASPTAFTCADLGANTVTLTVTDGSSNASTCTATVTISDTISPTASCQDITIFLDGAGNASIVAADINNGSSDNCTTVSFGASPTSFTCADLGPNTVTLTVTDSSLNTATCTSTVTVSDTISPTASCQDITVFLDGAGNASIVAADIDNGSSDNCTTVTLAASPTAFTCANVGTNTVTLTVTDGSGSDLTCTSTVTVQDTLPPVAICQDVTVYLDGSGMASVTAAAVDNGSTDNCGVIDTIFFDATTFDCDDILTQSPPSTYAVDFDGADDYLSIPDNNAYEFGTGPLSIELWINKRDNNRGDIFLFKGQHNVDDLTVFAGSDELIYVFLQVNGSGGVVMTSTNPITLNTWQHLAVTRDGSGNWNLYINGVQEATGSSSANINEIDATAIWLGTNQSGGNPCCQYYEGAIDELRIWNIERTQTDIQNNMNNTVPRNEMGLVGYFPMEDGPNSSTASDRSLTFNHGTLQTTMDPATDWVAGVGSLVNNNSNTLTVVDQYGNSSTCESTITVQDTISPVAVCILDTTLYLDASGSVSLAAANMDGGSTDNCNLNFSADIEQFTCIMAGDNLVTLTATDDDGNASTCTFTVSVVDTVGPVISGVSPTGTYACSGDPVFDDAIVEDECKNDPFSDSYNLAVLLQGTTAAYYIGTPVRYDAFFDGEEESMSINTAGNAGDMFIVNESFTDNGDSTFTIRVEVSAVDSLGNPTIWVAPGTTIDGNVMRDYRLDVGAFAALPDQIDLGANNTLTVSDYSFETYNSAGAALGLPGFGPNASNGSGVSGLIVIRPAGANGDVAGFDMSTLAIEWTVDFNSVSSLTFVDAVTGTNCAGDIITRTWTATDPSGNISMVSQELTPIDTVAPMAVCKDTTLYLDASGAVSITAEEIDNGSSDDCMYGGVTLAQTTFTCSDAGDNLVALVASDSCGNTSTCMSTITILDTIPPTAVCNDTTIYLDANGMATISADIVDGGSTDNCLFETTIDISSFNCSNINTNTVTLTVADSSGNEATCTALVTILDTIPPAAICQDITAYLDAAGEVTIAAADVDGGSNDACGIDSISIDATFFTCADKGDTTVTLTVVDVNGNTSTCTATVTVEDSIPPMAICQDITIYLDSMGMVNITEADVNGGAGDNCGLILSIEIDSTDFDCSVIGPNTVTLTITDVENNVFTCESTVTVADTIAPEVACMDFTAYLDETGNATITEADINAGASDNCGIDSVSLDITSFDCSDIGSNTVVLTAVDLGGNSVSCMATVTVEDTINVEAVCQDITVYLDASGNVSITAADVDGGSNDACGLDTLVVNITDFTCDDIGENTVTLTVTDNGGTMDACEAIVTVLDTVPPMVICQDITVYLDANGNVSITAADVDAGTGDACGSVTTMIDISDFDCSNTGANTVTLTATDSLGNMATCEAIVTVLDTISPTAVCQDITVYLDAAGSVSITAADVDGGSSDICGIETMTVDVSTFECEMIGDNAVTLTVTDSSGNSATCTATVEVLDTIAPTIICAANDTVSTDPGVCEAFVSVQQPIYMDNCGDALCPVDRTNSGSTIDGLTWDRLFENGTAISTLGPVTYATFMFSVSADGLYDISSIQDYDGFIHLYENSFDPLDQFTNFVVASDDGLGGIGTSDVVGVNLIAGTIYILVTSGFEDGDEGNFNNTISAQCNARIANFNLEQPYENYQGITDIEEAKAAWRLDNKVRFEPIVNPSGLRTMVTLVNDYNGTDDASGVYPLGSTVVTWTITDSSGNSATCEQVIVVEDIEEPVLACQDITVQLDANGNASIVTEDLLQGFETVTVNILTDDFPSETDWELRDNGGNILATGGPYSGQPNTLITEMATVPCGSDYTFEIFDEFSDGICCGQFGDGAYTVVVAGDTVAEGGIFGASESTDFGISPCAGSVSDNCGIDTLFASQTSFDCSNIGDNTVTVTVTDENGNTSTCDATVTVEDTIAPTAVCQDITVYLDAAGSVSITAADIDGGSTDNCAIDSMAIDATNFDCSHIGDTIVTLTVFDESGNNSSCTATVTVADTVPPIAVCQDITVYVDGSGMVSITAADVDGGSSDACGNIDTIIIDVSNFTCADLGDNDVELTVTDDSGNSATCTASVTVEDTIAPVAMCQDITVQLDANGMATIAGTDIDDGSTDNCAVDSLAVDVSDFDCSNVGGNPVVLTVFDESGNSATCTASVTVEDTIAPMALCLDITVQLDASGMVGIDVTDIDGGSNDACGLDTVIIDVTDFDCSDVGANTVTLTATDVNGNSATCAATVTVEDNIAPMAICQDITVQLDASGSVMIDANNLDNGSSDNCGIDTITADVTSFDCSNIGDNVVTVTVTDVNDNASTCTSTVTVEDNIAPTALCQDITVYLDQTGNVSITAADVDDGSSDNCPIDLEIDVTDFDCDDIGDHTVTLTVTDSSGNVATCSSTVTVADSLAPVLDCPSDTTLNANTADCSAIVDWTFDFTENCPGGETVTSNYQPGDIFPEGTTTVTYTVTDASGSSSSCSFDITVVNDLNIVVDGVVDVSCFGGTDGEIAVTVTGGTPPYDYRWSNNLHDEDIVGLAAGQYVLFVVDANGCTVISDPIDVDQPTPIIEAVQAVISDASCNGLGSGTIDITIGGGTPPYTYLWTNGSTDEDQTDLEAGVHQVTVTDANGCEFLSPVYVINESSQIGVAVVSTTQVDCNGASTGVININVSGGLSPYTFVWSDGSTDEDLANAPAGDYSVTVTDANGCDFISDDYTILENDAIEITASTVEDAECNGDASGSIGISAVGGSAPYTYLWSNGAMTQDVDGLAAGSYSVEITDALGCTLTSPTYTIGESTVLVAGSATVTEIECNGAETGSIAFNPTGGTAPYTYVWSDGSTDQLNDGLTAGTYSVTIYDVNGCSVVSDDVTLGEPTAIEITSEDVTNAGCIGTITGAIDIEVGGGNGPYTYLWNNSETTQDITGLSGGGYSVQITDANGCVFNSGIINVGQPGAAIGQSENPIVTDVSCNGEADGSIDVFISGGTTPYTFSWDNGETTEDISGLAGGDYVLTVTDANGCTYTANPITIVEPDAISITNIVKDVACFQTADGAIDITVEGGTAPFDFLWSDGSTTEDLTGVISGSYSVDITDANGCTFTSNAIVINELNTSTVEVTFDVTPSSGNGVADGSISATATGGSGAFSYEWQDGWGTNPSLSNVPNGQYCIEVTDANGCLTLACAEVEIVTGIEEISLVNNITLYPNPTADYATLEIKLSKNADVHIEMVDVLGRIVKRFDQLNATDIEAQFDVTTLASGTYFFNVSLDKESITLPLVITR